MSSDTATNSKFAGAAALESSNTIVFAPHDSDVVGIFDASTLAYTFVDISSVIATDAKFNGAVLAANGNVIFVPYDANSVGVFQPSTSTLTLVDISLEFEGSIAAKWAGGAAYNGKIYFAPYDIRSVGIFDPATLAYSRFDISIYASYVNKYKGAFPTVGGEILMVPYNADKVGLFDPSSPGSYREVDISSTLTIDRKFSGVTRSSAGALLFAPEDADALGEYDDSAHSFRVIDVSSTLSSDGKFAGAACAFLLPTRAAMISLYGFVCNGVLLMYYGAPLSSLKTVLSTRSAESIYYPTVALNGANSLFWSTYALAIKDRYLLVPNAIGVALAAVQTLLCVAFGQLSGGRGPLSHAAPDSTPLYMPYDEHAEPSEQDGSHDAIGAMLR